MFINITGVRLVQVYSFMKGKVDAQSLKAKIRYVALEYYSMNLRNIFIADPPKKGRADELKFKNISYSYGYCVRISLRIGKDRDYSYTSV